MKVSWFDLLIYRLFFWKWSKILTNRADLREIMISQLKAFNVSDGPYKITVSITQKEEYED